MSKFETDAPGEFGEHSTEVRQVLAFAKTGPIAAECTIDIKATNEVIFVDDIPRDGLLAGHNGIANSAIHENALSPHSYLDARSYYAAPVEKRLGRSKHAALRHALDDALANTLDADRISKWWPAELADWIDWVRIDLFMIAKTRAAFGSVDVLPTRSANLFEQIFRAYRAGAFPVGWTGTSLDDVQLLVVGINKATS